MKIVSLVEYPKSEHKKGKNGGVEYKIMRIQNLSEVYVYNKRMQLEYNIFGDASNTFQFSVN